MRRKIFPVIVTIFIILIHFFLTAEQKAKTGEESKRQFRRSFFWAEKDLFDARILLHEKDKIRLTRKQQQKAEKMMLVYEESTIKNSAEIKILEIKFASYLESGNSDRDEIAKLIKEISKRKTECIIKYMHYLLDLKEMLSGEQIEKLKKIHVKVKQHVEKGKRDSRR
jgi:hypothetical protein